MSGQRLGRHIVLLAVLVAVPAQVRAQELPPPPTGPVEDPAETAKIRIGPFFMQPAFGLRNVGIENNVFNEPADPKRDWTGTVNLGMLAGLRYGPARLTVKSSTHYVYFAKYASERAIDGLTRVQGEIRTVRFRSWVAMERATTHDRAGLEIDTRALRKVPSHEAGVEYRFGYRLGTRLMGRQREVEYDEEETFRGVLLGDALNAKYDEGSIQLLYEISPLSNFRLSGEVARTRFETATLRDATEQAVFAGIEGKKDAAIEGYIDVGWRDRKSLDPVAPSFSGLVARASASFVLWEQVRVSFAADRDIPWSYEALYPFYIQQGGSSNVTWRLHDRFEIFGTGRRYELDYRAGLIPDTPRRTDSVFGYGGGFGFFLHGYPGTRLGLTVERSARESTLVDRRFDNTRLLANVGFSF